MEPVEPVQKNNYQINIYRKNLSWLHLDNEPRVHEGQQLKGQQSCIFLFMGDLISTSCSLELLLGRNSKLHIYQHALEKEHRPLTIDDFKIIGKGCRNITFKKKIAEALLIRSIGPSLNMHEKFVPVKLFN